MENPDGTAATYVYDTVDDDDVITSTVVYTNENGGSLRYEYNPAGQLTGIYDLDAEVQLVDKKYDIHMRLYQETYYSDDSDAVNTVYYYYDNYDRVIETWSEDSAGAVTSRELTEYSDTTGYVTKTVEGATGAPSVETRTRYDTMGYTTEQSYKHSGTWYTDLYTNDYLGNVTQLKTAYTTSIGGTFTSQYTYGFDGRVLTETNALNDTAATNTYDLAGRLLTQTDAESGTTVNAYDALNRVITTERDFTTTADTVTKYYYDNNGNVAQEMVSSSLPGQTLSFRTRAYSYDSRNRLAASTSYDGQDAVITQYYYDDAGNILRMYTGLTSPLTITGLDQVSGGSAGYSTTEYAYDTQNRLVSTTDPLDQTESYTYDSKSGRMLTKTDRNDVVTTYTYDNLGRETRREAATGDYVATTYTLTGQKASESNGTVTTAYTYDDLGRLTAEVTGDAVKTYSYNLGGARTAFAAAVDGASQISLAYTYDAMNRLSTVSGNSMSASYGYTDNGNLNYVQYGNGLREEYAYNKANLLTGLVNELDNTVLSQYGYTYTLDGQQVQKTEPENKVTAYTYDGHGRLTDETVTLNSVLQQSYAYTYDAFGNRTGLEATGTDAYETAYTYDANNRLQEETKTTGGLTEIATYYYDANGNETAKVNSTLQSSADPAAVALSQGVADSELLSYNGFNELTAVAKGEDEITYAYLPNGLRLSKTAGSATTSFVWDGSNTVLELTGDAVTAKYLRGTNLVSSVIGGTTSYYLYNGHGDVVQLANAAGAVTKTYDYDAFGVEQSPSETDANPYRYCGEYFDLSSGTYYLRARYYDPTIGRFLSEDTHWNTSNMIYGDNPVKWNERKADPNDPLGLNTYTYVPDITAIMQSGNLYVYCMGNPIRYLDSTGELAWPGEIHNQVLYRVAAQYGLYTEQIINYGFGWGRADLVSSYGAIWDVKRDKPGQIASGVKQVQKYVANSWRNNPDPDNIKLSVGGWIEPGSFVYESGETTYYVTYRYAGQGVIAYDYSTVTDWQKVGETALGIVTVAGAAYLIYQTGGLAAPVLVPLLS